MRREWKAVFKGLSSRPTKQSSSASYPKLHSSQKLSPQQGISTASWSRLLHSEHFRSSGISTLFVGASGISSSANGGFSFFTSLYASLGRKRTKTGIRIKIKIQAKRELTCQFWEHSTRHWQWSWHLWFQHWLVSWNFVECLYFFSHQTKGQGKSWKQRKKGDPNKTYVIRGAMFNVMSLLATPVARIIGRQRSKRSTSFGILCWIVIFGRLCEHILELILFRTNRRWWFGLQINEQSYSRNQITNKTKLTLKLLLFVFMLAGS